MTPRLLILLLLLAGVVSGCRQEYLDDTYGRQRLQGAAGSVNGTDVLAAMFKDAGHDVYTRRSLVTSDMAAADIVVWFPNDMHAPRREVCDWFDEWLVESPGRTLIIVGRDFDAAPIYWEFHNKTRAKAGGITGQDASAPDNAVAKAEPEPKNEDQETPAKEHAPDPEATESDDDKEDADQNDDDDKSSDCRWFAYEPGDKTAVRELSGPWAAEIDAAKTRIEVRKRLVPKGDYEVLLDSDAGPLVSRIAPPYLDGSQIILVENGSFLLNLPLINHEHRKLAGELVATAGDSGSVVFLESGIGGPAIDPPPTDSSLWTLFQGWPLGMILLQLSIAGILFCFARWPIFGRPKQPANAATTDFSHHVAAVGELLGKSRDPSLNMPDQAAVHNVQRGLNVPTAPDVPPPAADKPLVVPRKTSSMLR